MSTYEVIVILFLVLNFILSFIKFIIDLIKTIKK